MAGNDQVSVTLKDFETDEEFLVLLSNADAVRAGADMVFAARLLDAARSLSNSPVESSASNNIDEGDTDDPSDRSTSNGFKWSHNAILLLIEEYRKQESHLSSGKISQKKVWEKIGEVLIASGHKVTGPQCMTKFNGMKRTFKSIKDHNSKSGNNTRTWPYLEAMESLLGEKPYMVPEATASSTGLTNRRERSESTSSASSICSSGDVAALRKRKASTDIAAAIESLRESRDACEEGRNRRHEERMEFKKQFEAKFLGMLDEFIKKK